MKSAENGRVDFLHHASVGEGNFKKLDLDRHFFQSIKARE